MMRTILFAALCAMLVLVGSINYVRDSKQYYAAHLESLERINHVLKSNHDDCTALNARDVNSLYPMNSDEYRVCIDPGYLTADSLLRQKRTKELKLAKLKGRIGSLFS